MCNFSFTTKSIISKLVLIASLFVFIKPANSAESKFKQGYIITTRGDTIYGLLDYKGNRASAIKCTFKKDENSENVVYKPEDLIAYRFIDDKYYVSKTVNIGEQKKIIFLEYLIDGIIDIYYYYDVMGEHYFIDIGDGELIPLENEIKEVIVGGTRYEKETKEYVGVLKYTFRESPVVSKKLDNIDLNHNSLIKISGDYHNAVCKDEQCIIYAKRLQKLSVTYGPLIGLNFFTLKLPGSFNNKYYYFRHSDFSTAISPSFGLFIKAGMPNLDSRLFIQYDITYMNWSVESNNLFTSTEAYYYNDIIIKYQGVDNSILFRFEQPVGKLKILGEAGGFFSYYFKNEYTRNLNAEWVWGGTYTTEEHHINPLSKYDLGWQVGLGTTLEVFDNRELSFDIRYKNGYVLFEGIVSSCLSLNIGIQIAK